MKQKILFLIIVTALLNPAAGSADEYGKYLPKWLELLNKGDSREKKLALRNLWFLISYQYRQDSRVWEPILNALKDKDPAVREAAAACLKGIGEGIQKDVDGGVWSSGCCRETDIVPSLIKALDDDVPRVRAEAAKALGMYRADRKDRYTLNKEERAIDPLIKSLQDKDPWVRLNAAFSLGELKVQRAVKPLIVLLNNDSDWRNKFVQQEAVIALRMIRAWATADDFKATISALTKKADDIYLRKEIIKTLGEFQASDAKEIILKATEDPDEKIRKLAIEALSRLPIIIYNKQTYKERDQRIEIFIKSLKDPSAEVRAKSAQVLGRAGDDRVIEPLIEILTDSNSKVKQRAVESLVMFHDDRIFAALINLICCRDSMIKDLSERKFIELSEKTAVERVEKRGRDGFTNFVHPVAVTELLNALNRGDQTSKVQIIRMMGSFHDKRISEPLIKFLDDPSPEIRKEAVYSLGRRIDEDVVPELIYKLKDSDPKVRHEAARTMGRFHDKRSIEPLIERTKDIDGLVRTAAISSLKNSDDMRIFDINIELLNDKLPHARWSALENIKKRPDRRAVDFLIPLLNDMDGGFAALAAEVLGIIGDKKAIDPLIKALNGEFNRKRAMNGDNNLRIFSAKSLGLFKDKRAAPPLIKIISTSEEDLYLRKESVIALGEIGDPSALDALDSLLKDERFSYKMDVKEAIKKIKGEE